MVWKIDHDFIKSNLSSVSDILAGAPARSLTRISLEATRDQLLADMAGLEGEARPRASTALFFSGKPVWGTRGIESEFASKALGIYQDIVTKLFALRSKGWLGERGIVADRDLSRLHVTGIVRGSFGFLLEDAHADAQLENAPDLKEAVDATARLVGSFAEEDEEHFESAVTEIDNRVLQTVGSFFEILAKDMATFRIIAGESERTFDRNGIMRAAERARATTVDEDQETVTGVLQGVMPDKHEFELRTTTGTIGGKVMGSVLVSDLVDLFNRDVIADVIRMRVSRGGSVTRQKYRLVNIRPTLARERLSDPEQPELS